MLQIVIKPCLLGFAVTAQIGNGFMHPYLFGTFHEVLWTLLNTDGDYQVTLR